MEAGAWRMFGPAWRASWMNWRVLCPALCEYPPGSSQAGETLENLNQTGSGLWYLSLSPEVTSCSLKCMLLARPLGESCGYPPCHTSYRQ